MEAYLDAIAGGDLNRVIELRQEGVECDSSMTHLAAELGHLDILIWFHENTTVAWDQTTFARAARSGNLKYLQYLVDNNCPYDSDVYIHAAQAGQLDVLKYLHKTLTDCEWTEWACAYAARNGHLGCLKYLHRNGCTWNKWVYKWAYSNNRHKCLQYLKKYGNKRKSRHWYYATSI